MYAIEIEQLYKSYDGQPVLRGLDLHVPAGQAYGLLGSKDSGKSTLMHLLLGFLHPSQGRLRVLGSADLDRVRGMIGYVPERSLYHLRFSAREYLRYLGRFSDLQPPHLDVRIDAELQAVGLSDAAGRRLSDYSKGMLQRLGIAQALLAEPALLLIDEPTSGLDPAEQREVTELVAELRSRGLTIFLTTQDPSAAERMCGQVGILHNGRLAREIDIPSLQAPGRSVIIRVTELASDLGARLERLPGVSYHANEIVIQRNTPFLQAQVLHVLLDHNVTVVKLEPQGDLLGDLYLRVMRGEPLDHPESLETGQPPNGLFAPPGHPDALRPPPGAVDGPWRRDSLLNELFRREDDYREPEDGE